MTTYIALPADRFNEAMNALGSLPANHVRGLLNKVEAEAREVNITEPAPLDVEGEIVTQEERDALLKDSGE